jgi:flagellar hook-basal body complex protein FliE
MTIALPSFGEAGAALREAPQAFEPDAPLGSAAPETTRGGDAFGTELLRALDATGSAFARADAAERAFVAGRGGLQEMVLERAQADVLLSLVSATASRGAQALSTLLAMQL